jgi:lipoprotein-anchoring transpeptidase ErfK/SrfK
MFRWKKFAFLPLFLALVVAGGPRADAAQQVTAKIDLSEQRLYLYVDGRLRSKWPVSTARKGYRTPTGSWRPTRLERDWHSRKYNWAPMPYSVFFYGGYAIHGTTDLKNLGRPASHGCIRLHPKNAARLFNLVRQVGRSNARVVITR